MLTLFGKQFVKLQISTGKRKALAATAAGVLLVTGAAVSAAAVGVAASHRHVGPQGDGTSVTPVGWSVTPAGRQTTLGDKPFAEALSPKGDFVVVVDDGVSVQSVQVVDTATGAVLQTIPYLTPQAVYGGVAFSPDGTQLYVSGGGSNEVHVYTVTGQTLTETAPIKLPVSAGTNPFPTGLAVAPDGKHLFVAEGLADSLALIDLGTSAVTTSKVGHNPYGVAVSPDGSSVYVANQGTNTVSVVSAATGAVTSTVTVGTHPNNLLVDHATGVLYVANGDSDAVSVVEPGHTAATSTISLAPYQNAPVGSNPDALALSSDGRTLYVADAGDNAVAVVHLGKHAADRAGVSGLIPTAWYPTGVAVSADGKQLFVANAKGLGAGPNPNGPNPYTDDKLRGTPGWAAQYIGTMIKGSLSTIAVPDHDGLAHFTDTVRHNDGFDRVHGGDGTGVESAVIPERPGMASPIKHVIYVVKENRTYDQEFGSLGKGNGDPGINLFGDESAPNARALQRQFVTLDNFYADSEVSADGWNWSTAANANPYVQQTWLANYGGRNHPYEFEGGNLATGPNADPTNAYLWDRLSAASVPYRNYGFFLFGPQADPTDPVLDGNTDHAFHGYDLNCPDSPGTFTPHSTTCGSPRLVEWEKEFQQYVTGNNLPTVELLRLPSDHTRGTAVGYPTPRAYVADNDYALGKVVDDVSHSPYWASTAIFVLEDDAQAGPDHVDAHRTIAQVISPYTQTGKVDSTQYSTVSMLRTIELITGLHPMTQFDALATPMAGAFTSHPNLAPYTATKPATAILTEVNGPTAPMAAAMAGQSFTKEDQADPQVLNQAIWESVKGAGSPMPASVDAAATGRVDGDG